MTGLYILLDRVAFLFILAIIGRAILSWFAVSPYHPVSVFLTRITEPVLAPLRRYIPRMGMLDLTPLVAILLVQIVRELLPYLFGLRA